MGQEFNPLWPEQDPQCVLNSVIGTLAVDGWAVTFWYSEEGPGRAVAPPRPLLAVPNVTAHPSMASVPSLDVAIYCLCTLKG